MKWNKFINHNTLFAGVLLFLFTGVSFAQGVWDKKPTNLKVLPDSTSPEQLKQIMHNFTAALDVRCDYCHDDSKGGGFNSIDFASDAKDEKKVARVMMKMVASINNQFIQQASQIENLNGPVSCVTCHHGIAHIESLSEVLLKTYNKNGLKSMFEKYDDLKKKYYGGFTYDFKDGSLNTLGYKILETNNYDDAIKIFDYNANLYPESWQAFQGLGEAYIGKGDKTKAKESFEKSLSINPRNRMVQEELKKL